MADIDMKAMFDELDSILGNTNFDDVTADSAGFEELQDGYYLCEVEKAELKMSKSSKKPMAALSFKVVADGLTTDANDELVKIKKSSGRKVFLYWSLKDERTVKRFASDMQKFEESEGQPVLPKEAFMNSETLNDALDIIVGMRVYINVSTTENEDGSKSTWKNLISWKRANALELPTD